MVDKWATKLTRSQVWDKWKKSNSKHYRFLMEIHKLDVMDRNTLKTIALNYTTPKSAGSFVSHLSMEAGRTIDGWLVKTNVRPIVYVFAPGVKHLIGRDRRERKIKELIKRDKTKPRKKIEKDLFPDKTYENIPDWDPEKIPKCFKHVCAPGDKDWKFRVQEEKKYLDLILSKHKKVNEGFKFIGYSHNDGQNIWEFQFEDFTKARLKKTKDPRYFNVQQETRRIAVFQARLPKKSARIPYPRENILHYWLEDKGTYLVKGRTKVPDSFSFAGKHAFSHRGEEDHTLYRREKPRVICLGRKTGRGYQGLMSRWHGKEGYSGLYEAIVSICMAVAIDFKSVKLKDLRRS